MICRGALALAACLAPPGVMAETCMPLQRLMDAADTGFAQEVPDSTFADATACDLARVSGGGATYLCYWEFAYRDPAATDVLNALDRDIRKCLSGLSAQPRVGDVNHPDTYLQKAYQRGTVTVSAALKDKAALAQTLIFLRLDAR